LIMVSKLYLLEICLFNRSLNRLYAESLDSSNLFDISVLRRIVDSDSDV
jgi:hypothetical protein